MKITYIFAYVLMLNCLLHFHFSRVAQYSHENEIIFAVAFMIQSGFHHLHFETSTV